MKSRPGLMILLAVVAVFAGFKIFHSPAPAAAVTGRGASEEALQEDAGHKGKSSAANRPLEPPVVATNLLTAARKGETFEIGRDLFRYAPPKPKAPEPGKPGMPGSPGSPFSPSGPRGGGAAGAGAAGGAIQPVPAGTPLGVAQNAPPAAPQTPVITFKYLGSFGPPGQTLAVFSDNSEIIDVLEGETFSSQFILKRINRDTETVEIGFVGFDAATIQKLEVGP